MYSDWLALTGRCVVIGFLSPLLSLSCLVSSRRKKISGTRLKNCLEEHVYIRGSRANVRQLFALDRRTKKR